jgi:acyl-CoA dehydrogenase
LTETSLTPEQAEIRAATQRVLADFDDAYWHDCDENRRFPEEFVTAMAKGGWLGIAMPQSVGGAGLGLGEAAAMMQAVTESGAGFTGASSIHLNIFGLMPLVKFGTDEQRAHHLPRIILGEDRACFGVTEPDSGLDTTSLKTFAAKKPGGGWRINGRKMWTSGAQTATKILLIVRTTPKEDCAKSTEGMSLFYTDVNRDRMDIRRIPKMGRNAVDTNAVFIDDLDVPDEDLVGEVGKGFRYLLHGLNPERVLFAAESVGLGRAALRKASQYAQDRHVFGRPIGQNQGIQHPLAKAWMELEAANLMAFQAARLYDADQDCGAFANAAKYLGAEAGFHACETAVLTHGGMGYAREFHVERYFRESMIARLAPVSREMIFNYIAERELGQTKSY